MHGGVEGFDWLEACLLSELERANGFRDKAGRVVIYFDRCQLRLTFLSHSSHQPCSSSHNRDQLEGLFIAVERRSQPWKSSIA